MEKKYIFFFFYMPYFLKVIHVFRESFSICCLIMLGNFVGINLFLFTL